MSEPSSVRPGLATALAVIFEAGLGVAAVVFGYFLGVWPLARLRLVPDDFLWGVLGTLPLAAGFVLLVHWPIGPFGRIKEFLDRFLPEVLGGCGPFQLGLIALAAGFGEELLFRGLVQDGLTRWFSPHVALALAALVFGLAHLITVTYAISTFVIGLYLGWLLNATDNLLVPILVHFLYDWFALVYFLRLTTHRVEGASTQSADGEQLSGQNFGKSESANAPPSVPT